MAFPQNVLNTPDAPHWSVAGRPYLIAADPVLVLLISQIDLKILPEKNPDIYKALLRAVLGQQISVKAAQSIWQRFLERFGMEKGLSPQPLLETPEEDFRALGLSRQKTAYVKSISGFAQNGGLALEIIQALDAEALTAHLTQIKGVGRWTAEMIQMFALDRPDVFSPGDLGIQNAMRKAYGLEETGKDLARRMTEISGKWAPYRTLACRYLWKSLELKED